MTRIIIRTVQERGEYREYLSRHLPLAEFCFDTTRNAFDTFEAALRMAGDDAVIHMEDDAILTRDFLSKIEGYIKGRPDKVLQFYSMRPTDIVKGSRWESTFSCNVCFYLPAGYSRRLAAFIPGWRKKHPEHPTGYDTAINEWLGLRREPHFIHCPSLVDHRQGKSIINPRRSSTRRSKTFIEPLEA